MNTPDRQSPDVAKSILQYLLPDTSLRKAICVELASFWQYAKRNFQDKAFITLSERYVRMNVGMVEVFVIHPDESILVVVDKTMVAPCAEIYYKSLADALPIQLPVREFPSQIEKLRPAIFSIINKLGKTRKHPSAPIGHSPALAEILTNEYPYDTSLDYPDEVSNVLREGGCRTITINAYERNPEARAACLRHYGTYVCQICGFNFPKIYGSIGCEFIHVHHLRPVAAPGHNGGYIIDPANDLLPVCPNCHAMLHTQKPEPLTPEEMKKIMSKTKKADCA